MNEGIDKLIKYLEDPSFQNRETGKLFHPTYIYLYDAEKEYELQNHLLTLQERLKRPTHFLDCLGINLYEELIEYLKSNRIFDTTVFDEIIKKEATNPAFAQKWVIEKVDNAAFIKYLITKIKNHFEEVDSDKRVYLLVHGVGDVFPYLRASDFLKRIEGIVKNFKVILFYPGQYSEQYYNLFGNIKTDNIYRANLLNQLI